MTPTSQYATTKYWHRIEDGRIQCDLCPRYCRLHEGKRGLCFVRKCENDAIVLTTWGRSSGFCVDPIEKKPLNHFHPGTSVLSFGTAGCNLACKFCQNWDISKSREMDTLGASATPKMIVGAARKLGCKSIAFTYNDPIIFHEYAIDIARIARTEDINTVAVTAGYICDEPRKEFFQFMDAANIDLKAFSERFYKKLCGASLKHVLETLEYVKQETDVWLELTTLLIPGENDSTDELERMCAWVASNLGKDVPMHFSAFRPEWKMRNTPATPPETLTRAREIALRNGIRYAYTGNVHDSSGGSTRCHHCDALLIERDWYQLGHWGLDDSGNCLNCGTPCPGHFAGPPGNWGRKQLPVRLGPA